MHVPSRRRCLLAFVAALSLASLSSANPKLSRQQADAFSKKLDAIVVQSATPGPARRTPITEAEINSWMVYTAKPLIPEGVADPSISIIGNGKVSGRAIVDFDSVSKQKSSGGTLDPWRLIGGKVPVTVNGTLNTKDGVGRFELESARVSSVPVPKFLLQELLSYYSRSAGHPDGLSLDDPFQLPANIRQIEVGQGQAVIVQ